MSVSPPRQPRVAGNPRGTEGGMTVRFYLFISEKRDFILTGNRNGYETLAEAKEEAKRRVDDACRDNAVWIVQKLGHAYLGGDGDAYLSMDGETT